MAKKQQQPSEEETLTQEAHHSAATTAPEEAGGMAQAEVLESILGMDVDPLDEDPQAIELESLRQQMLRVQADFDNFRKRTRTEKDDLQRFATRGLLTDLLPVADNFDRALQVLPTAGEAAEVRTGLEMVQRQLLSVLNKHGVTPMDVVGQSFDPAIHEAVMEEAATDGRAGIVAQELQRGYLLHDKVLRPAMVKVTV